VPALTGLLASVRRTL